jgi:hypothetical protein
MTGARVGELRREARSYCVIVTNNYLGKVIEHDNLIEFQRWGKHIYRRHAQSLAGKSRPKNKRNECRIRPVHS